MSCGHSGSGRNWRWRREKERLPFDRVDADVPNLNERTELAQNGFCKFNCGPCLAPPPLKKHDVNWPAEPPSGHGSLSQYSSALSLRDR